MTYTVPTTEIDIDLTSRVYVAASNPSIGNKMLIGCKLQGNGYARVNITQGVNGDVFWQNDATNDGHTKFSGTLYFAP